MILPEDLAGALEAAMRAGLRPEGSAAILDVFAGLCADPDLDEDGYLRAVWGEARRWSVNAPESAVAQFWASVLALELAGDSVIGDELEAFLEGDDGLPR